MENEMQDLIWLPQVGSTNTSCKQHFAELADGAPVNRSVEYIGEHGCHSRSESLRLVFDPATGNHGIADRDERQRFAIR